MLRWPPYDGDNEEEVVMQTRTWVLTAGVAALLGEAVALWAPGWAIGVVSGAAIFLIAGSLLTFLNETAADAAGEYGERRHFGQKFSASLPWKINQPRQGAAYDVAAVLAAELSDLIPQDSDIAAGADRLRTLVEQAPQPFERVDPDIVHVIQQITEEARSRFPQTLPVPARPTQRLLDHALDELGGVVNRLRPSAQTTPKHTPPANGQAIR
jgi:hypothetical protein